MRQKVLFKDWSRWAPDSVWYQNGPFTILEFEMLAEGYREAAQSVVNALSADETFRVSKSPSQGFRLLPAIFLYRQALELTLKGIILAGSELVGLEGTDINLEALYRNHNFESMRVDVERIFEAIGCGWDLGVSDFRDVKGFRQLLAEFDEFDGTSALTRYPVDGRGKPWNEEERPVNLFDFAQTMDRVLEVLVHAPGYVHYMADEYLYSLGEMADFSA